MKSANDLRLENSNRLSQNEYFTELNVRAFSTFAVGDDTVHGILSSFAESSAVIVN